MILHKTHYKENQLIFSVISFFTVFLNVFLFFIINKMKNKKEQKILNTYIIEAHNRKIEPKDEISEKQNQAVKQEQEKEQERIIKLEEQKRIAERITELEEQDRVYKEQFYKEAFLEAEDEFSVVDTKTGVILSTSKNDINL